MFWLLLAGLVALVVGAVLLVKYGSNLAERLGISPLIIGLTIVSVGTSVPELAVGIDAMRRGAGSLMLGNIVGTDIVNILLILGLAAAIRPVMLSKTTVRLDLPAMVLSSVLLFVMAFSGYLTTANGLILLLAATIYGCLIAWNARREKRDRERRYLEDSDNTETGDIPIIRGPIDWKMFVRDLVLLIIGIVIIVFGAEWLVDGAIAIAESFGVSQSIIGLTIVAIGTSLPELATTLSATFRGKRDIAVGNLIGSSTLNTTLIFGIALMFGPYRSIIDREILRFDFPILLGVFALCVIIFVTGHRISRREGILMVSLYVLYLGYRVFSTITGHSFV